MKNMWHAIFPQLLFAVFLIGFINAEYFTEGGSYRMPNPTQEKRQIQQQPKQKQQLKQLPKSPAAYLDNELGFIVDEEAEEETQPLRQDEKAKLQYDVVQTLQQQKPKQQRPTAIDAETQTPNRRPYMSKTAYMALENSLSEKSNSELKAIIEQLEKRQRERQMLANLERQQRQQPVYFDSDETENSEDPYEILGLRRAQQQMAENDEIEANQPKARQQRLVNNNKNQQSGVQETIENELQELQRFGEKIKELTGVGSSSKATEQDLGDNQNEQVLSPTNQKKPKGIQKKGQSEFVEFVDPSNAKKLRNMEYMEKRVANEHGRFSAAHRGWNFFYGTGNIAFLGFITVCCVLSVMGVVGGMYYYNQVRSRNDDPFDDFTRYSPAGPGRDKLNRGNNNKAPNGQFIGELGDDTLAYKAQLHHYQQTKQKIIGVEEGRMGNGIGHNNLDDMSDRSDDEADLEHNFSVYECPGLAPTGDIEVQNPNFVEK